MIVMPIKSAETYDWLINKHYAKRIPSISYSFGLFVGGVLSGIVCYGTPASSSLLKGVCGKKYMDIVIELNRLCIDTVEKNAASYLVGNSIKQLPKPKIIISYADTSVGHVGYVYQATNFLYTGLSAKRTDWKIKGEEHLHGATIADRSRGKENRVQYMRDTYGNDFYLEDRPRKHRYVYFHANKLDKKKIQGFLNYGVMPYPKGETIRHNTGKIAAIQGHLFA